MRNCLRADFARLWKSRLFWLFILFCFGTGVLDAPDKSFALDSDLLSFAIAVLLLGTVFAAFFIGTDYSDGTIRNKLIIGNSRAAVYFSNLIVCCAAAELMILSFLLPTVLIGSLVGRGFIYTAEEILFRLLIENIALLAALALIVLIAMLMKSRSSAIVAGTFFSLALILCAMFLGGRLAEPEYFQGSVYIDEDGNLQYDTEAKEANPTYVRGTMRKVLEVAYDVLPGGQINQMTAREEIDPAHGGLLLLYSAGIFAASVLIGVPVFQRRDLK